MPPLIIEEEMDTMSLGNDSDAEPMSAEMLEDICDSSQSHPRVNMRQAHYKIRDRNKLIQVEWNGALLSTQNMDKGLHKVFKAVVNEIL